MQMFGPDVNRETREEKIEAREKAAGVRLVDSGEDTLNKVAQLRMIVDEKFF